MHHLLPPWGIVLDAEGNLYVSDADRIRYVTSEGVVTTVAGGGTDPNVWDGQANEARFYDPWGIAIDASGNLYVADDCAIRTYSGGYVGTLAGASDFNTYADGMGKNARFHDAMGVAVDNASGNVYVADTGNNCIRKITPDGEVTTLAGKAGGGGYADGTGSEALFFEPEGIAIDKSGNLYVADGGNNCIRKITPAGVVTAFAGGGGSGQSGYLDGTGTEARFTLPYAIAIDGSGNLYVTEMGNNNCIRKITPEGVVTTVAGVVISLSANDPNYHGESYTSSETQGHVDGAGSEARFGALNGITVNAAGNLLYVTDGGGSLPGYIRKIEIK